MTETADAGRGDYTTEAHKAILQAGRDEHDSGGWLAGVLTSASADLGSTYALIAERPGSGEASVVQQLVKRTVGHDDHLADYKEPLL